MSDIYDIKNILNINPFYPETVYIVIIFIVIFLIFLLFIKCKQNYNNIIKKWLNKQDNILNLKKLYLKKLNELQISDADFFLKINFIIRKYLEVSWILDKSTKKTSFEIKKSFIKTKEIVEFVDLCNKFEFSLLEITEKDKKNLLEKAKNIIESPE